MKSKELVAAVRAADNAVASGFAKCKVVAELMVEDHNPNEPLKDELDRLVKEARKILTDAKVKLRQERNMWQYVRQWLLVLTNPTVVIEITPPTEDDAGESKAAEDCVTAAEIAKAAKQIRDECGLGDGRSNNEGRNAGAMVARIVKDVKLALGKAKLRNALVKALADEGITLTTTATRRAKRPKADEKKVA